VKNKLSDLNDHLFAQLERLSDEDITGDQLLLEMERTKSITAVARELIAVGELALDAEKAVADGLIRRSLPLLGNDR
jgi:hypothetical protein